eukprot:190057_1
MATLLNDNAMNNEIISVHKTQYSVSIEEPEETAKSCRICYEIDRQDTMICPCLCSGDLKFVHRKCLDQYRAISVSNPAFTTCNTCTFDYIMEIERNHGCLRSPKAVFRLRVAFDIFKIAFCWFGTVSLFAFILLMTKTKDTTQSAYLWGCGIVFALIGIVGVVHGCVILMTRDSNQPTHYGHTHGDCCTGCIWFGPLHFPSCDCHGGSNDASGVCLAILAIVAIILIIVGVVYSIIVSAVLISQMAAGHYSKMNAKEMIREYIVKNLEKYSKDKKLKMQQRQQMIQSGQMPVPSAPCLDTKSIDHSGKGDKQKNTYVTLS